MDRLFYREILRKNLLQSCQKLGLENSFVFQQGNDPKHTAEVVKDWLKQKKDWNIELASFFTWYEPNWTFVGWIRKNEKPSYEKPSSEKQRGALRDTFERVE